MLNYIALFLLIFVGLFLFYGIIVLHDIPYEIAKKRKHPHQDAIHVGGWVSMFTLHAIWPFLWLWAMLYHPDKGWGMGASQLENQNRVLKEKIELLTARINEVEWRVNYRRPRAPETDSDQEYPATPVHNQAKQTQRGEN